MSAKDQIVFRIRQRSSADFSRRHVSSCFPARRIIDLNPLNLRRRSRTHQITSRGERTKIKIIMWISRLKRVRRTIMVLGVANFVVIVSGCVLTLVSDSGCDSAGQLFPLFAVCFAAGVKLAAMVKVGTTQELMAMTIMDSPTQNNHQRKVLFSFFSIFHYLSIVNFFF